MEYSELPYNLRSGKGTGRELINSYISIENRIKPFRVFRECNIDVCCRYDASRDVATKAHSTESRFFMF